MVYLTEIELVKQVLVTNCYKYWRPSLVRLVIPSLGNSLLTSNGKDHAWQRKMINPAFSYTNLKGMVPSMKSSADDLVQVCKYWRTVYSLCRRGVVEILTEGGKNILL